MAISLLIQPAGRGGSVVLLCLVAGCSALRPDDADPAPPPRTPQQAACAGAVKELQAGCSPNLLRAGNQGLDCSADSKRILSNCGQPR